MSRINERYMVKDWQGWSEFLEFQSSFKDKSSDKEKKRAQRRQITITGKDGMTFLQVFV
ncbi:hypothetical protein [Photobacterium chitinilyticum]|uniref:hypothetical protein n=1 Tax=Photobacterium chitinilyticum TaxID=2485123 RepID=UPI0013E8E2C6|nr:hypothetical protein [Photobacterium chitinilyticum]